jgi:hypothetical protein
MATGVVNSAAQGSEECAWRPQFHVYSARYAVSNQRDFTGVIYRWVQPMMPGDV